MGGGLDAPQTPPAESWGLGRCPSVLRVTAAILSSARRRRPAGPAGWCWWPSRSGAGAWEGSVCALGAWLRLAATPVSPVSCDRVRPSGGKRAAGGVTDRWGSVGVWGAGSRPAICWFLLADWVPAVSQGRAHGAGHVPRLAFTPHPPFLPLRQQPCPCHRRPPTSHCVQLFPSVYLCKGRLRPASSRKPSGHSAFPVCCQHAV